MKKSIFFVILLSGCVQQVDLSSNHDPRSLDGKISVDQVALVEQNKSAYEPSAFLSVAQYYYQRDQLDRAARYFLLGLIRTNSDAMGCYDDATAFDGAVYNSLSAFFAGLGASDSKQKRLMFYKQSQALMEQAFQENEKIPYSYNRLWPYKSGMKIFINPHGSFPFADDEMQKKNLHKIKEDIKKMIVNMIEKFSKAR